MESNVKKLKIKPKKYSGNSTVVSLRMPEKMVEKIDAVAELTDRTRNDIVLKFIDFALENLQIDKDRCIIDDDDN